MFKIPSPPSPPSGGEEFLRELAAYYQELVEYHRRGLALATGQLQHINALLEPEYLQIAELAAKRESLSSDNDEGHKPIVSGDNTLSHIPRNQESRDHQIATSFPAPTAVPLQISQIKSDEVRQSLSALSEELANLLELNRGKIVHIDYLVRKNVGLLAPHLHEQVKGEWRAILQQGEKERMWFAVPDSPDCWTIDLKEIPDLAPARKSSPAKRNSQLPDSAQIRQYGSFMGAIAGCLMEHAPQPMSAIDIYQWLYPDGLATPEKNYVFKSLHKRLSSGCDTRGWKRIFTGSYVWVGDYKREAQNLSSVETLPVKPSDQFVPKVVTKKSNPITQKKTKKKKKKKNGVMIPDSPKIELYGGLAPTVAVFLQQKAPGAQSISQVLEWVYEGVKFSSDVQKRYARSAITKILSHGCGQKGWHRVSTGIYAWRASSSSQTESSIQASFESVTTRSSDVSVKTQNASVNQGGASTNRTNKDSTQTEDSPFNKQFEKHFPKSPKLEQYGTLTAAITSCLSQTPSVPQKASEIVDWLYPDGLSTLDRKLIYQLVSNTLNLYSGSHWRQLKTGFFLWDEKLSGTLTKSDQSRTQSSLPTQLPKISLVIDSNKVDPPVSLSSLPPVAANPTTETETALVAENTDKSSVATSERYSKNLPMSPRLKEYGTLNQAIIACLKSVAPEAQKTSEIVDWLYPNGLSSTETKSVYSSVRQTLSSYRDYKWKRVGKDGYAWDEQLGPNRPSRSFRS